MASNELFKLSQERHEKTYAWILEDIFTQNHAPKPVDKEKRPRIIVVAAQPGTGKSHLLDQSKEEFMKEEGVIVINGDELRDYHPKATEIMKLDDKRYAEFTDPDSRKWTRRLLEDVTKRRHNVIFECTFNNPGPIMATMQRLHEQGIVAVQKDKVFQEIAPGTLVEHKRSSVGPISAADTGKTFSISYEGKRTATVKNISRLRERGGVER